MATAPQSRRLNLTRDQLAAFLTDHQQIRQFELLFSVADTAQYIPDELAEVSIVAGNAQATANQALAELSALAQDTAVDDAVLNAKVQQALDAIPGLAQALELLALAPRQELGTIASQNADNVNITGGLISGLDAPLPVASGGIGVTTAAANRVFAGPTSGASAAPSFRALVSADIPSLPYGDVVGPASATDNAVARFDTTTGKLIQNSVVTISDTGATTGVTTLGASTSVTTPIVQASNSAGLSLKNASGTTQMSVGAGGGDNMSVNVSTNLNGTNAQIDISPTGTGHVHIKPTGAGSVEVAPTNVGTIDNMTIGATTPKNASFVDLSVTGTTSFDGAQGTSGQVLTSAGTGNTPTWTTPTTGTVTAVSVVSANGLAGTVATSTTTPAITLSTTITGLLYGNGTALAAATINAPLAYSAGTLSITQSGASTNGYLSSTDWNTFNNKGSGTVTSVAALTLGTTGTDLSSTVANSTTTPVITLNVPTASATNRGALSSTDWTTFNNKEPAIAAGTTAQYWRGDKTWQDLATAVRDTVLTGLSTATNAVITAADTVLSALGKLQKQISDNLTTLTSHTSASSGVHGVTGSVVGTTDTQSLTNKTLDVLRAGTTGSYKFQAQTLAANPYYGTVAYWPADAGSNQQAYRVIGRNGGSNILLTIEKSTTTQSYGADPSLLSYSEVYSYNDIGVFSVASGIKFPATQVASADANTLDDYEEGSWSPTVTAGSGSITSYSSTGTYTKIGRVVTISCYIQITNNGTGGSYLNVAGLPFTIGQQGGSGAVRSAAALGTTAAIQAPNGGTSFTIWRYDNTYPVATNSQLNFSFSYFV